MEQAHLERQYRSEMDEFRREVEQRLRPLETPAKVATNLIASPNYILNSHPEWSKAAWQNTGVEATVVPPAALGDDNRTAYNWYYQTVANSGQDLSTSSTLIADEHSAYSSTAETPVWDRVNGRFLIGHTSTAYDVAAPLSRDFVFPGQRYYVYFETILLDETTSLEGAEFYCGFWDNTSGQRKWIEGSDFTPTASIYGAGGTRTLTYKILAATDGNEEILSVAVTVANAPNTLTATNHVRLSFAGAPGFISFKIYRFDGTTYRQVGEVRNSIDLQFYDMDDNAGTLETGFPVVSGNRPIAREATVGLTAVTSGYTVHTMVIQVPTTYNRSNTTNNQQWLRWGLSGPISAKRGLAIRRMMVSEGFGPWVRAQGDLTLPLSSPTTGATSSPVSGRTIGTNPKNGPYCVTLDTLIDTIINVNGIDIVTSTAIKDIEVGTLVACGALALPVQKITDGTVQEVIVIKTATGRTLSCSTSHRVLKSRLDKAGTAAAALHVGDNILIANDEQLTQDTIVEIIRVLGEAKVRTLSLPEPHLFVTNGIVSHNLKEPPIDPTG